MTKLNDTEARNISTEYESYPIIRAAELVGLPIIIWAKRKATTTFGEAMFVDYHHAGDADQNMFTAVFSAQSPAFRQLDAIKASTISEEGLEVVVLEAGRSFKLADPDDVQMVSHPEAHTPPAAPAKPAAPTGPAKPQRPNARPAAKSEGESAPW